MNKLYKYRPLSEFLFKELKYNELYFASYPELNDPLDLSTRINFKPKDKNQLRYLLSFLIKTSIFEKEYVKDMVKLYQDEKMKDDICNYLFSYFNKLNISRV